MSIEVPIYDNSILGSEYLMIQQDSRDRGLQKPLKRNPEFDNDNNEFPIDLGLNDPSILLENNNDPSETQIFTDAQALLNIQMSGSLDRPMSREEQELMEFVNHDLNSNLRLALVNEAERSGDNIYSQQSQDFVNQYREDIASYVKELNLYLQDVPAVYKDTPAERALLREDTTLSPADAMLNALNQMRKEEQDEVLRRFKEREQFVKPSEPRLEEKLEVKEKTKPNEKPKPTRTGFPKGFRTQKPRRTKPMGREAPTRTPAPKPAPSPQVRPSPQVKPSPSRTPPAPPKPAPRTGRQGRTPKGEL